MIQNSFKFRFDNVTTLISDAMRRRQSDARRRSFRSSQDFVDWALLSKPDCLTFYLVRGDNVGRWPPPVFFWPRGGGVGNKKNIFLMFII